MNEGLNLFLQLAPEQIMRRLRRCGIEADPGAIGRPARRKDARESHTYSHGQDPASYRQHYRVVIFNLAVLECQPLGAGAAMNAAFLGPVRGEGGYGGAGAG
ncbi:hypothetical protein, partial [Paenibacillus phytohabitans]|uniref:hypothetical protein n=1 Tax=Paenibacillus phytohabitans TaxID=2654978 RepID=UPI00300B81F8